MQKTKLSFLWSTTVAIGLALGACGGDDGSGDETNNNDSTGADPTTNDPTTNDPTTNDPTTNDPTTNDPTTNDPTTNDPTTDTDPSTTDVTVTDTDATESGTTDPDTGTETGTGTGGGEACAEDPEDSPCSACTKEMCCSDIQGCIEADPNCGCVLDCLGAMKAPGIPEAMQCATDCDADFAAITPSLLALQGCQGGPCADACGG